jgi:hypothetical protein
MRESQMKKIIALAVASAFALPVMAADVTLSGDVEYKFSKLKNEGIASSQGDSDIKIVATEEVGGMSITATIENKSPSTAAANTSKLAVAGAHGTVEIGGSVDHAVLHVDEMADVAESGLGDSNPATPTAVADVVKIAWTLPTIVDGLTIVASYGAEAGTLTDDNTNTEQQHTSIAAKYSANGLTVAMGSLDGDAMGTKTTFAGISYTTGPFYVAYQSASDNDGTDGNEDSAFGVKYNYGSGNLYFEDQKEDTTTTSVSNSAYGISYAMGALNTYVELQSGDTDDEDGMTVGVEYAF